ncbi:MAG: hypothetical protein LBS76_02500 [Mycoplasmataceae bacterium]|nr:hypothetical protein [Mycoplasmataceae bacterium]
MNKFIELDKLIEFTKNYKFVDGDSIQFYCNMRNFIAQLNGCKVERLTHDKICNEFEKIYQDIHKLSKLYFLQYDDLNKVRFEEISTFSNYFESVFIFKTIQKLLINNLCLFFDRSDLNRHKTISSFLHLLKFIKKSFIDNDQLDFKIILSASGNINNAIIHRKDESDCYNNVKRCRNVNSKFRDSLRSLIDENIKVLEECPENIYTKTFKNVFISRNKQISHIEFDCNSKVSTDSLMLEIKEMIEVVGKIMEFVWWFMCSLPKEQMKKIWESTQGIPENIFAKLKIIKK